MFELNYFVTFVVMVTIITRLLRLVNDGGQAGNEQEVNSGLMLPDLVSLIPTSFLQPPEGAVELLCSFNLTDV